jgi:hypothetical protein
MPSAPGAESTLQIRTRRSRRYRTRARLRDQPNMAYQDVREHWRLFAGLSCNPLSHRLGSRARGVPSLHPTHSAVDPDLVVSVAYATVGKSAHLSSSTWNKLGSCDHASRHDVILLPLRYKHLMRSSVHACLVCPDAFSCRARDTTTLFLLHPSRDHAKQYFTGKRLLICCYIVLARPDMGEWHSEV